MTEPKIAIFTVGKIRKMQFRGLPELYKEQLKELRLIGPISKPCHIVVNEIFLYRQANTPRRSDPEKRRGPGKVTYPKLLICFVESIRVIPPGKELALDGKF